MTVKFEIVTGTARACRSGRTGREVSSFCDECHHALMAHDWHMVCVLCEIVAAVRRSLES